MLMLMNLSCQMLFLHCLKYISKISGAVQFCFHAIFFFFQLLAAQAGCEPSDICDFELQACDTQPSVIAGAMKEFIFSGRLDNLCSSFCSLKVKDAQIQKVAPDSSSWIFWQKEWHHFCINSLIDAWLNSKCINYIKRLDTIFRSCKVPLLHCFPFFSFFSSHFCCFSKAF